MTASLNHFPNDFHGNYQKSGIESKFTGYFGFEITHQKLTGITIFVYAF
jgi:hypothetical protein